MRSVSLLLATAFVPAALAAADTEANNYWIRASLNAWMPALSGDFSYQQNGGSTATNASTDELGLGDREVLPMLDVDLKVPLVPLLPSFHLGLYSFSTEGSETLARNITFGGTTFTASSKVDSKVSIDDLYGELYWTPIDLDLVGVGFGIGLHSLTAEASVESEKISGKGLMPVLSLHAHVNPLDMLGFELEANGMSVNVGDFDGTYLDVRLQALWRPINWLGVMGGYRHILVNADIKDGSDKVSFDITLSGPYLGALAQF